MYETSIDYDRATRDYAMRIRRVGEEDWELVGFASTQREADVTLTELIAKHERGALPLQNIYQGA